MFNPRGPFATGAAVSVEIEGAIMVDRSVLLTQRM
jgi:hypothetical protein